MRAHLLNLVALVLAAPNALAEAPKDQFEAARAAFDRGLQLMDKGQPNKAVLAFERSLSIRDSAATRFNLGLALMTVGKLNDAFGQLNSFLKMSTKASHQAAAQKLIDELLTRGARVTLRLIGEPEQLFVDRALMPLSPKLELLLSPGLHTFKVTRTNYLPIELKVQLVAGRSRDLELNAQAQPLPAQLTVRTEPAQAQLELDGEPWDQPGQGLRVAKVQAGPHKLDVSAPGYRAERRAFTALPGQRLELQVSLKLQEQESIATKWWLWTSIAAVIAAGVTAGVLAATLPDRRDGGTLGATFTALGQR